MPHSPAWFPRTTFLSVKRASVTERIFLQVWWQFSQSVVSPFPSFGKEGWLKAGVVGGYTMLIITDLRIHLPPPPTGTPPSRRRRMEIPPTINCQVIILPIHLITKFFLFVSLSLSFVSRQKKESCNTNVTSMTSPCNLKLRPLQAEITYTHLWRQFIYALSFSSSY